MNAYFASYLHYNGNEWVKPTHTYLLMPCTDFINNCVLTFGVKLAKKIGLRKLLLIALFFAYLSCFLLIVFPNYFIVLIAMGIFGVGSGFGYFPPIENCWKYYPTSNALIFGICVAGLGLSSSILTPLADYFIVNPKKEGTDEKGYYPKDIADNLKTYLYILTGIYVFLGVVAFLLAFEYEKEDGKHNEENKEKLINGEKKEKKRKKMKEKKHQKEKLKNKKKKKILAEKKYLDFLEQKNI
jgi:Na+/melibiose symporter-like transporter